MHSRINHEDWEMWELNGEVDDDYITQMTSEHKVLIKKGMVRVAMWVAISGHAQNHYWDCENIATALADMLGVELLPDAKTIIEGRDQEKRARSRRISEENHPHRARSKPAWFDGSGW